MDRLIDCLSRRASDNAQSNDDTMMTLLLGGQLFCNLKRHPLSVKRDCAQNERGQ